MKMMSTTTKKMTNNKQPKITSNRWKMLSNKLIFHVLNIGLTRYILKWLKFWIWILKAKHSISLKLFGMRKGKKLMKRIVSERILTLKKQIAQFRKHCSKWAKDRMIPFKIKKRMTIGMTKKLINPLKGTSSSD